MKRLAAVVLVSMVGFVAAIAVFSSPEREGCPLDGPKDGAYSGRFEGAVSIDQTRHVVRVTRYGRPVTGAEVCVTTSMVGMSGMGYTAEGRELGTGRYQVGFRFGMAGDYRTNVVTRDESGEVSIPLTVKVGSETTGSGGGSRSGAGSGSLDANLDEVKLENICQLVSVRSLAAQPQEGAGTSGRCREGGR